MAGGTKGRIDQRRRHDQHTAPGPLGSHHVQSRPDPFKLMRGRADVGRSEEHTSELQSLMRISYAVFCLKKKTHKVNNPTNKNMNTHHSYALTLHYATYQDTRSSKKQ